jgi:hypothetical protein
LRKTHEIFCLLAKDGGRGGIRTPGTVTRTPDFESGAFNHSATLPHVYNQYFTATPPSDTVQVNSEKTDQDGLWEKTRHTNLIRYKPSGTLFARFKVKGKLIRSLKTDSVTVGKLRLTDCEKQEQQRAATLTAVASGKMTFGDALTVYRKRLEGDVSLKPRSKKYRQERIAALLKSWSTLDKMDVARVTKAECA